MPALPWEAISAYILAVGLSLLVALTEILSVFQKDPLQAIKTRGAILLLLVNGLAATCALALVLYLAGGAGNPILMAIGVGLGVSALLRSRFSFLKPLPTGIEGEGLDVRLDQIYDRLQRFCRQQIDIALASSRVKLVDKVLQQVEFEHLEYKARLLLEGGLQLDIEEARQYVDKILGSDYSQERKKLLLVFAIMDYGGRGMLKDMLREARKSKREQR